MGERTGSVDDGAGNGRRSEATRLDGRAAVSLPRILVCWPPSSSPPFLDAGLFRRNADVRASVTYGRLFLRRDGTG